MSLDNLHANVGENVSFTERIYKFLPDARKSFLHLIRHCCVDADTSDVMTSR